MAHDDLLIAGGVAGATILIAGGSGNLLIAPSTPEPAVTVGGPSGGKTTPKGYQLVSDELGNRPVKHITTLTKGKLRLHTETMSKGMLQIPSKNITYSIVKPFHLVAFSASQLQIKIRTESAGLIRKLIHNHSTSSMQSLAILQPKLDYIKKAKKMIELFRLYQFSQEAESVDNIFTIPQKVYSFDFEESPEEWMWVYTEQTDFRKIRKLWNELKISQRKKLLKEMGLDPNFADLPFGKLPVNVKKTFTDSSKDDLLRLLGVVVGIGLLGLVVNILESPADQPIDVIRDKPVKPAKPQKPGRKPTFTMPSSFVGRVTYNPDFQILNISLPGKIYSFCDVPERIFDSFKGAGSKGAFFNRNIKTQFDC